METFTPAKALVDNPDFNAQRRRSLAGLADTMIDAPIRRLVGKLNDLPHCFTLQCCYGHFLYAGQADPHHLGPLPTHEDLTRVTYRIAYLALCVDNGPQGAAFLERLAAVPRLNPDHIQFGSAEWFWERQVNTYVLQVMPARFEDLDQVELAGHEARQIEILRSTCFHHLLEQV